MVIQYSKGSVITYKNDSYLVLKYIIAILPIDDRVNYFKIPKTQEEFYICVKQYIYE